MGQRAAPRYTVLIPAHDEEHTIGACLRSMEPSPPECQTIVICNACSDATAAAARGASSTVRLIETEQPGKWNAINLGLAAAGPGPVIIVDADVRIDRTSLGALASVLSAGPIKAASPAVAIELNGADAWVQAYYRVFQQHGYLAQGVGASGVYGLSARGREEIGSFPDVIADDGYVRSFFSDQEQCRVFADCDGRPVQAIVRPPKRLSELLRTEARWRAGDRQVRLLISRARPATTWTAKRSAGRSPRFHPKGPFGPLDLIRYVCIKVMGRLLLWRNRVRGKDDVWYRDSSSRASA